MKIKDMFEKPVNRNIQGVIKVDQNEEKVIAQELDEYIVTDELLKHFKEFYNNYNQALFVQTDDIGVWISGFFGSGKSHFLKILSYLLANKKVQGKYAIDYFKDDQKITDQSLLENMENASQVDTEVILFNIDSKSSDFGQKDKILDVFVRVFNEHLGYSSGYPFLADLEKNLDLENKYQEFKDEFENIYGSSWVDSRDDFYFIQDDIIQALVNIGYMTEVSARNWADKAEENYSITIEQFAQKINDYCESKGSDHHLIFLVDEVGQYVSENTQLMLNLQTLTENLGSICKGKSWLIVTGQQNIDEITDVKGQDFSKIQGRFKTRLSLSSANVDEVIKKRILAKTDEAKNELIAEYPSKEPIIKNLITFKDSAEMKTYNDAEDYASTYPFVPYQFNLLQSVLTAIREHGASGKHLAEGERSMLALYQESLINIMNEENDQIVSFDKFYSPLSNFIDHMHNSVIIKASDNENLDDFDVEVLKVLFLIRYVKEIKSNIENITTLMLSSINDDKLYLEERIESSLKRLLQETLIQKDGNTYSFLTNEEQDVSIEIKKEDIKDEEILANAASTIFDEIFRDPKYRYNDRYNFDYSKVIDDVVYGKGGDIGLKIISPLYDLTVNYDNQATSDELSEEEKRSNFLKELSNKDNNVLIYLNGAEDGFNEIREVEQIKNYLRKNTHDLSARIRATKQEDINNKNQLIHGALEDSIKDADIYVKGQKLNIRAKQPIGIVNEALKTLIDEVYIKLGYMENAPKKADILSIIEKRSYDSFEETETLSSNALNELDDFLELQSQQNLKTSLNDIIKKFKKEPYGFVDKDIEWLILKLFSQKRISLTLDNEEISFKNENEDKLLDYITKKEYREKVFVTKKKEVSERKIDSAKEILSEVFGKSKIPNDEEDLIIVTKEAIKEQLDTIKDCLKNYDNSNNYPGEDLLLDIESIYEKIYESSSSQFFDNLFDSEEDILSLYEEVDDVLSFFENQKTIFDEAISNLEIFDNNKLSIDDDDLLNTVSKIERIVKMPAPYSSIKDLVDLNKEFTNRYNDLLEEEKVPVRKILNELYNETISAIDKDNDPDDLRGQTEDNFNDLNKKLDNSKNFSEIKYIPNEADTYKESTFDHLRQIEIKNQSKEEKTESTTTEVEDTVKSINIRNLITKSHITLNNDDEINDFVDDFKSKLEKELEENKKIDLKFI